MTFPSTKLGTTIELLLGGVWTDITPDVFTRSPITIGRGRSAEAGAADPGSCSLTLDNKDGKYSPRNPTSPLYGLIGRNTRLRVSVPYGTHYAAMPGLASDSSVVVTADHASLDITGDLDVRMELDLVDWHPIEELSLMGKFVRTLNQRSWRLSLNPGGALALTWSTDGVASTAAAMPKAVDVPSSGRLAVRATLDVNNGSGGWTVTFYTAPSIGGTWTQVAQVVTTSGTTSIFSSTAPLEIGNITAISHANFPIQPAEGRVYAAEVRNGIAGTVVAAPDFTAQPVGNTAFTDSAGRLWTFVGVTKISDLNELFLGEVPSWPTKWTTGGKTAETQLQVSGLRRRYGQGNHQIASTLRRRIPTGSPFSYWPMEDGQYATQAYSPITGVAAAKLTGFTFASDDSLAGSSALPVMGSAGTLTARPPQGSSGAWHMEMVYNLPQLPAATETMLRVDFQGGAIGYVLVKVSVTAITLELYSRADALLNSVTNTTQVNLFYNVWNRLQLFSYSSGGLAYVTLAWRDTVANSWTYAFASTTGSHGTIAKVSGTWGSSFQGLKIGHLATFETGGTSQTTPAVQTFEFADSGFAGESAIDRLVRLTAEEDVPFTYYDGDTTQAAAALGAQRPATLMSLLQECADADLGILSEDRRRPGFRYRDRTSLYNQTPALVLDYAAGQVAPPLDPLDDDQAIRNIWTVTRTGGSSGRVEVTTGPNSTADPPTGAGPYEDSATLNLYSDDQPVQIAGWLTHLGTWDAARIPSVKVLVHKAPSLIPSVLALDCGDRIQILHPPVWAGPDVLDLLVQGYTIVLKPHTWEVTYNCTPGGPWVTGVAGDTVLGHVDTDGSRLAAGGATSTSTSLSVETTTGPLWTMSAGDFPFDVVCSGERMTVTNITGASSPQTFTVTRSVNGVVKALPGLSDIRLFQPAYAAL